MFNKLKTIILLTIISVVVFYAQTRIVDQQVTKLPPSQLNVKVMLVESAACVASGTSPDGMKWYCNGLFLYRFRMSDGTMVGPFFAILADKNFIQDAKWTTTFSIK